MCFLIHGSYSMLLEQMPSCCVTLHKVCFALGSLSPQGSGPYGDEWVSGKKECGDSFVKKRTVSQYS